MRRQRATRARRSTTVRTAKASVSAVGEARALTGSMETERAPAIVDSRPMEVASVAFAPQGSTEHCAAHALRVTTQERA
jgi:hypothetical protein